MFIDTCSINVFDCRLAGVFISLTNALLLKLVLKGATNANKTGIYHGFQQQVNLSATCVYVVSESICTVLSS